MFTVTATDLPRLMACNGSRLMNGFVPLIERDDTVKLEGDAAHWLCQEVHAKTFTAEELIDRKAPNGNYISVEMVDFLSAYLKTISEGGVVEFDTSFGDGIDYQINSRSDHIIYDEVHRILFINDLKYGWSILEPEKNWTMIAHAIGWIKKYGHQYKVEEIFFSIYQPRPYHPRGRVRTCKLSITQLYDLQLELNFTLKHLTNELHTGEHCYKCPAYATCPAARKAEMNGIEASEKAFIDTIDNDNLYVRLDHLKRAQEALKQSHDAYEELALHRIREGQIIQNYSLENDLTNNQWKKGITVGFLKILTGKKLAKESLITPNQAKKEGVSEEVVKALTERHNKGVKLVRVDAHAKAKKMFEKKGN